MKDVKTSNQLPQVTIVLAIYHPREDWLIEQLASLNRQTYRNLELIICDDCPEFPIEQSVFQKYITNFSWRLVSNEKNIGSNKTFELLTTLATGEYIAYCDQDDIWEDNKIELLVKRIVVNGAELCYSDLSIIDENSNFISGSISKIRKRHVFKQGANLATELIVRNFVTGCAMIMKTETAKAAIPFERYMVHDHWLAFFSALHGKIAFEPTATVRYRQHANNQTSVLAGVNTKDDYYMLRIDLLNKRVNSLTDRMVSYEGLSIILCALKNWVTARESYYFNANFSSAKQMWTGRRFEKNFVLFELVMPLIPKVLFRHIINLFR